MPVFLFLLFEVAEARSVGDGALAVDRAAGKQQGIDQRGLARSAMAGDRTLRISAVV